MNEVPILVIIFNRPDFAIKLFEVLEKVKPKNLYVISDGPRNEEEALEVEKSRAIFNKIHWPCLVKYDYSNTNIGLRKRITSGIDWAFENEEKLIILEDDCIPHPDFFKYCRELLSKYADDKRIMTINGCNLKSEITETLPETYLFSKYANSWGWATWKRSWKLYDSTLSGLDDKLIAKSFTYNLPHRTRSALYWHYKLRLVRNSKINSWAYRWMFSLWTQNGLAIVPKNNLIQNIGSDNRSSNTKGNLHYLNIKSAPLLKKTISHPQYINANIAYDNWLENSIYSKSIKFRLVWLFKKLTFQI